ncbi:LysR substrate-binding domain-containing protein [Microbacterium sp. B2969]|uniref:LysR substrate-binding domain-containing protein n=1 Tax=Microbacterium alkaliflavum TaxID=3248839 RepID=A0ABW7QFS9_9MICO
MAKSGGSRGASKRGRRDAAPGRAAKPGRTTPPKAAGGKTRTSGSGTAANDRGGQGSVPTTDDPPAWHAPATFVLGEVPGATPGKWVDIWRERMPQVELELRPIAVATQREELLGIGSPAEEAHDAAADTPAAVAEARDAAADTGPAAAEPHHPAADTRPAAAEPHDAAADTRPAAAEPHDAAAEAHDGSDEERGPGDETAEPRAVDSAAGPIDAAIVRLPIAPDGLHVIPLYEEQPVVVVSKDSHLNAADELELADLEGEVVIVPVDDVLSVDVPGAQAPAFDPPETTADAIATVAAGVGIVIVPMSLARLHHRRDAASIPLRDGPVSRVALAWPADRTTPHVETFVGIVRGRTSNSSRA